MKTKIEAAKIVFSAGTDMVITSGKVPHPLRAIKEGARVTWFIANSDPVTAKKRWISGQLVPNGQVFLDAGAEKALLSGKSLLPAGVTRIEARFESSITVCVSVWVTR